MEREPVDRGTVETGPGWRSWRARSVGGAAGDGPDWAAWSWARGGRPFPWLGVFVVLIGVALLIQQLQPAISLSSLLLVALGAAFGAAWILGRVRGAFVPAAVLLSLAAARLAGELGYLVGNGWTSLFLGIAFGLIWLVGRVQGVRRDWALWVGVILGLIGLVQISGRVPALSDLALLWPLVIIALGGALLLRSRLADRDRRP